jgi:hypothetical protein
LSIKGRRIKARSLYNQYANPEDPMTMEQIAAERDLPVAAVAEAIAYCESDPWEMHQDWMEEEALTEAAGINHPDYKLNAKALFRPIPPQERMAIRQRIDALHPPASPSSSARA